MTSFHFPTATKTSEEIAKETADFLAKGKKVTPVGKGKTTKRRVCFRNKEDELIVMWIEPKRVIVREAPSGAKNEVVRSK